MSPQPLSVLITIFCGLVIAGLLGWVRKPRLVVFFPRLFSHSKISDKGQIIEISVMNRGFKTEEGVELSLSPYMHYELIGGNNPDASLVGGKLFIPRIGSADDCSVLLLVENGKFTQAEIIGCLSKETKAVIATKLEDVPVTAQQRVGILMFFGVLALGLLIFVKGMDYIIDKVASTDASEDVVQGGGVNGWSFGGYHEQGNNSIYKSMVNKELVIVTDEAKIKGRVAVVPFRLINESKNIISIRAELVSASEQDPLSYTKRTLSKAVVFQGDSVKKDLEVTLPADPKKRKVIVEIFVSSADGEMISGRKVIDLSGN